MTLTISATQAHLFFIHGVIVNMVIFEREPGSAQLGISYFTRYKSKNVLLNKGSFLQWSSMSPTQHVAFDVGKGGIKYVL